MPVSLSHIHQPLPLVDLTTLILHNTFALSLSLLELTVVDCLFVLFQFKGGRGIELLHIELTGLVASEVL